MSAPPITLPQVLQALQEASGAQLWGVPLPAILGVWLLLVVLLLRWHPNRHPMNRGPR